jgi:hypothetical protein
MAALPGRWLLVGSVLFRLLVSKFNKNRLHPAKKFADSLSKISYLLYKLTAEN